MFPDGHGKHATPSEIAITQWAHSGHIKVAVCDPRIAPEGPIRDAADYRKRFPDGRIGSDPTAATPRLGGQLVAIAAEAMLEDLELGW